MNSARLEAVSCLASAAKAGLPAWNFEEVHAPRSFTPGNKSPYSTRAEGNEMELITKSVMRCERVTGAELEISLKLNQDASSRKDFGEQDEV